MSGDVKQGWGGEKPIS